MNRPFFRETDAALVIMATCVLLAPCETAFSSADENVSGNRPLAAAKKGWGWKMTIGAMSRNINSVSFETGLHEGSVESGSDPGSTSDYADHEYDNGYVLMDPGTASDGDTWYWGYDSASQVGGGNIVFNGRTGYESGIVSDETGSRGWKDSNQDNIGAYVSVERVIKRDGKMFLGLELNGTYVKSSTEKHSNYSVAAYERMIEDTYDLQGIVPPAAPYRGSESGPGPLLDNIPNERRSTLREASNRTSEKAVFESLDLDLVTASLGMVLGYESDRWNVDIRFGPSGTLARTKATHEETDSLTGENWYTSVSDEEWLIGAFSSVGIDARVAGRLGVRIQGRYDWTEKNYITGSVGPSTFEVDPDGWSVIVAFCISQ